MEDYSDYVVVFGRGLTQFDGEWQMSIGTQRRVEAALEYTEQYAVDGIFLLGGYSKWAPVPPPGVTEAGLMLADIQDELDYGVPVLTDEGMTSRDTFDNAVNLAALVRAHDMNLTENDRLLFASGSNHFPRISQLSGLAIGLSEMDIACAFDRIPVAEDSRLGAFKEAVGRLLLKPLLLDIEPGDITELRKAQDIMDDWLNHKIDMRTIRQIVRAMGMYTFLAYGTHRSGGYFSSQYEH
ncbi:MAG TPA: ElyC/SanA/YdcF family protein [Verrucomicrobiae bacterium]|nr:ElyC/SanA/YdcF family protein [Verrucomicrobiae bacterium]